VHADRKTTRGEERDVERYDAGRTEKKREREEGVGGCWCRDGFSRGVCARRSRHRGSGTRRLWGPPGFEERRNT